MTTLVGLSATDRIKSGDRIRATWEYYLSSLLPSFLHNAPKTAADLQVRLPSMGFVPVSPPTALPGAESIVYDLQLSQVWGTATPVAQIVETLGNMPYPFTNLKLTKLEAIDATASASDRAKQLDDARTAGEKAADTNKLFEAAGKVLGVTGNVIVAAVLVAAGVATFILLRDR
jgi:hypothetical protein